MNQNVVTFGCRLNAYESEVIKSQLQSSTKEKVMVFNTCAVTKEAERQAKQAIRRARREHPDHKIVVTGCSAQINPDQYASMHEVDQILGNQEKLSEQSYTEFGTEKVKVNDIMSVTETASHMVSSFEGKARAFVQIQNGCNHRCTFCIIPYGRGNSRSVPVGEIVKEVKSLVSNGYQEVVLTGVDITDYGLDLPGKVSLGNMMKRLLLMVPELPRLRLSSVDVAEMDNDLLDLLADEPRLMPYFHISLQAGDNMILKRMKRRHSRQDVVDFCKKVRKMRPDAAFGADIIAGFPTEDDKMFNNTLELVHEVGLSFLHVFPYSEREGTPAAKMPAVPMIIRKKRAAQLRQAGENELQALQQAMVGSSQEVIIEKNAVARCKNFVQVKIDAELKEGSLITVSIDKLEENKLYGSII